MKKLCCLLLAVLLCCPAALAEDVQLVASFYPVYIFAQNILQDVPGVSLSCMTAPSTGCLHDYQLLAGDMLKLSKADALLINGAGMEVFLPAVKHQLPEMRIVDCSEGIELLCADEEHHHDHDHEHKHEAEEYNAHIWLDPKNAIQMVKNMESQLIDLMPEHAETIAKNASAYITRLEELDAYITDRLLAIPSRQIVTFHDSFPYFAKAYDLHIVAVVSMEPEDPLSPQTLTDVIHQVTAAGNPPLFAEPQYRNAALEVISRETGAPVYLLDPLVTGDGSMTAYEDVMKKNLHTLLEALSK
ncbi:MAG: zinc ABC transporter substrate-binding protein [Clostridia bacterium]|nr:zinc ABC transporter substrate-binding protein [Clostridia bacterium]